MHEEKTPAPALSPVVPVIRAGDRRKDKGPVRQDDPPVVNPLPLQSPIQRPDDGTEAPPARVAVPPVREGDDAEVTQVTTQPPIKRSSGDAKPRRPQPPPAVRGDVR